MVLMAMIRRLCRRALRGRASYRDVADCQWVVCPGEETEIPPAVYLPGELDKVVGVPADTTRNHEMQRIHGGVRSHGATMAYALRDAEIRAGYVYKGAMKLKLTPSREPLWCRDPVEWHSRLALGCTLTVNRYFGHWMTDGLVLKLLARTTAPPVTTERTRTTHQMQYADIFNIAAPPVSRARVAELIVFDDVGQNACKRERYRVLRGALRAAMAEAGGDGNGRGAVGAMLLRGTTGQKRVLLNEQQLAARLARRGFAIIDPEAMAAREIARLMLDARIVIGVEGSQLGHGLFPLAEGGAIVSLQPPDRFNNVFKDYADAMGLRYAFAVGTPGPGGFHINPGELDRLLDLLSVKVGA